MSRKLPEMNPKKLFEFEKMMREKHLDFVKENPWIVPPVVALTTIPVAIAAVGFFHNRSLKKKLKIEREKTKQMELEVKLNQ